MTYGVTHKCFLFEMPSKLSMVLESMYISLQSRREVCLVSLLQWIAFTKYIVKTFKSVTIIYLYVDPYQLFIHNISL